jgi:mono/diheme cytochrome c family protein
MNGTAKSLGLAWLAALMSLTLAFAFGRALQVAARRDSHQQPADERWWEAVTSTSPALIAHGRSLFLDSCAHCHGADARGDEGPDLHEVQVSDRYVASIITRGIKGEMPSFAKKLHAAEITALTAYLRSLE